MKKIYFLIIIICAIQVLSARSQNRIITSSDLINSDFNINEGILINRVGQHFNLDLLDTGKNPTEIHNRDSIFYDVYGDLLDDDKEYNPKYSLLIPSLEIILENALLNRIDVYVLNLDFAKVSTTSWNRNLNAGFPWGDGWWWDRDRFGNNFMSHPATGSLYFNSVRSSGYSFWTAYPFTLAGAYMWKIFGENGKPEREDIPNTTFDGVFLGEVLYRLSSNVLDDRTSGSERFGREFLAFLLDPIRGINRLLQGKTGRTTPREVYQKEPLTVGLSAGMRKANEGVSFWTGKTNEIINVQLDYGDPFEDKSRKAFDVFKFRGEFNFGAGRKIVDNLIGYGLLTGKTVQNGDLDILYGIFQNYDYWDNTTFEYGSAGFTGGIMTKYNLSKNSNLYTKLHIGYIPLAGASKWFGPSDTIQSRDYDYGTGMQAQFETNLNLGRVLSITLRDYNYWVHTFNGPDNLYYASEGIYVNTSGNTFINIIKPQLTLTIAGNLRIGFEQLIYYSDMYSISHSVVHRNQTEQKIFLTYNIEDFHHGNKPDNKEKNE